MSDTAEKSIVDIKPNDDGSAVATFIEDQQKIARTGDDRLGRNPDADDDEGDRGNAGAGNSSTERSRSAKRRDRMRQARQGREAQLEELRGTVGSQQQLLETLMLGQGQQSLNMLEGEAEKAKSAYAEAERRYAEAVEKGEGTKAAEATRVMNNATTYYNNVAAQHSTLVKKLQDMKPTARQPAEEGGRIAMTARGTELRNDFLDRHPFIDLRKNDDTTVAIKAIEARVASEGHDPNKRDYWDEVSDRVLEAMPHLFEKGDGYVRDDTRDNDPPARRRARREELDDEDDPQPRRRRGGPPLGDGGRDGAPREGDVFLKPDMVKALEESGIPLTGGSASDIARRNKILGTWRDTRPTDRR